MWDDGRAEGHDGSNSCFSRFLQNAAKNPEKVAISTVVMYMLVRLG